MGQYLLAYHGGSTPESEEAGAQSMRDWTAWLDGLGSAVIDRGNPTMVVKTLSAGGGLKDGAADPVTGYSVIRADSFEHAAQLSKDCPHFGGATPGTIEIAEIMEM